MITLFHDNNWRVFPIAGGSGNLMKRYPNKKKYIEHNGKELSFSKAMPSDWLADYSKIRRKAKYIELGGVICGKLDNLEEDEIELIALDCDSKQSWDLFDNINPDYKCKTLSVGKEGGTIFYKLTEELEEVKQYSIKNTGFDFELMTKRASGVNSMVFLPTVANKTKEPMSEDDINAITPPPLQVIAILRILEPKKELVQLTETGKDNTLLPYNQALVDYFVTNSKANAINNAMFGHVEVNAKVQKIYKTFTPRAFRGAPHYKREKWLHPNSNELLEFGSWSTYIVGLSAIAGADSSINAELYTDFIQAVNAQIDNPMDSKRLLAEIIVPMVSSKSKINGQPIWKYNRLWDSESFSIINQYGENIEFYVLENFSNTFLEYNHTTQHVVEIKGIKALRDQIYVKNTDAEQAAPAQNVVKKLKLLQLNNSIKKPLGIFVDPDGKATLNTKEPCYALQVLRNPDIHSSMPGEDNLYIQAFNIFLEHLLDKDVISIEFMKRLIAIHGRQLKAIPVIIYIIGIGGSGKSIFADFLEKLFGTNATSRPTTQQVKSRFNDFLIDTAILIMSETSDSEIVDQKGIKAVLKTITGENALNIEGKYKAINENIEMFALPVLLANSPWYQEDDDDRRLFSMIPKTKMIDSEPILDFERQHSIKITTLILEGIENGTISKYISTFYRKELGEVPTTKDKLMLSEEQKDPISVVKALIAYGEFHKLFNLFEEHDIDCFFTFMELPQKVDKEAIYKGHLIELCKAVRGENYGVSDSFISKQFTALWQPNRCRQFRPSPTLNKTVAKKMGYLKWDFGLFDHYERWKTESLLRNQ